MRRKYKIARLFKLFWIFLNGKKLVNVRELIGKGRYSYVNDEINSDNFPDICVGKNEKLGENVSIAQFVGIGSLSKMMRILEGRGYRPANVHEVAGYCNTNPDAQRVHSIVALGSPIIPKDKNEKHFPCFSGNHFITGVGLIPVNSDWSDKDRNFKFAVVLRENK